MLTSRWTHPRPPGETWSRRGQRLDDVDANDAPTRVWRVVQAAGLPAPGTQTPLPGLWLTREARVGAEDLQGM